jgi:putative hemolysin
LRRQQVVRCSSRSSALGVGIGWPVRLVAAAEALQACLLRVRAHANLYTEMNRMARADINPRAALRALPPLIKGYLRLGGFVGDGAVVDRQFNTTDVFILVPVSRIADRYQARFEPEAE